MQTPTSVERTRAAVPRSRKGAQTRARLLEAAKAVFERDGFLEARVSDIAEQAGVSHGSFYHYFDSKEEVFREVAAAVEERLTEPMTDVILDPSSHATPEERIREALRRHLEAYRQEARIMGVIEQVSWYDEQVGAWRRERQRRWSQQVADSIRNLQEHGLADPGLDPTIAAAVLGSMTSRFPEAWFVQGSVQTSFEKGVDQLTRVFVNALGLADRSRRPGVARTGSD